MGAKDYMVVDGPAPASYGAGNMGAQLYSWLSNLQKQAFEQRQRERTESLQQPILGPDGQPSADYSTLLRGYLTKAGAEAVPGLLPGLIGAQSNQAIYRQLGAGGSPPPSSTGYDAYVPGPGMAGAPSQPQMTSELILPQLRTPSRRRSTALHRMCSASAM
jgi:hypothetical protein